MSTALMTDKYELTMIDAALQAGTASRRSVFETFARRLPGGRRYGIVAGTGRLMRLLKDFRFDDETLGWLSREKVVSPEALRYLEGYTFTGRIHGYAEGECYFPGSPILTIEGTFADAVILETLVLSVLNHDSAIATAASRMVGAAQGRPCLEMGARRTQENAAVAAARAAYIAGFEGTSMLKAGEDWGIPTIGTASHAFTLLHDDELAAFRAQVAALGSGTTLLVDTYDVAQGVRNAIAAGGTGLAAVRIDSGDLPILARETRALLDSLGATGTHIVVTSDLDEYAIAALGVAPVDSYGVGTALVTGSGKPTAEMVYKLVAREAPSGAIEPVAKRSVGKASAGGAKHAARRLEEGVAAEELVAVCSSGSVEPWPTRDNERDLIVTYQDGSDIDELYASPAGLALARDRHRASVAELPRGARRLSPGDPALPTTHA